MSGFDIPVVLFFYKRSYTALQVLNRIAQVRPRRLYLISDGPRNNEERSLIEECRKTIEERIDWDCQVIKNYASSNRGVYDRIGLGARWVFSQEQKAIFLEDDNLPELTFFEYCRQLLDRYENDTRILWICGTNYLEKYEPKDGSSYVFTKHLLPCGWASWSHKFLHFYDGDLNHLEDDYIRHRVRYEYENRALYKQQIYSINRTKRKMQLGQPISWDFQMAFSIRIHGLYGIAPKYNQIKNIGVDKMSTHGGTSYRNVMTRRFCGMDSFPLEFPLSHPKVLLTDVEFEKRVGRIIQYPTFMRIGIGIVRLLKPVFGIHKYDSFLDTMKERVSRFLGN